MSGVFRAAHAADDPTRKCWVKTNAPSFVNAIEITALAGNHLFRVDLGTFTNPPGFAHAEIEPDQPPPDLVFSAVADRQTIALWADVFRTILDRTEPKDYPLDMEG